ncbi:MAG: hypothetical protein KFF73_18245 [Cyclobacteriaceae bacterium]|nr:hypothetical protein [Cyclobacteriaceae bacterium]
MFGKAGKYYFQIARGIDNREVNPNRIRKSLGAENTFSTDLMDLTSVIRELDEILDVLHKRMLRHNTLGKTLTVKVKYADFKQITRSRTSPVWIAEKSGIRNICMEILADVEIKNGIRLLGLTLSNLNHTTESTEQGKFSGQLTLDL